MEQVAPISPGVTPPLDAAYPAVGVQPPGRAADPAEGDQPPDRAAFPAEREEGEEKSKGDMRNERVDEEKRKREEEGDEEGKEVRCEIKSGNGQRQKKEDENKPLAEIEIQRFIENLPSSKGKRKADKLKDAQQVCKDDCKGYPKEEKERASKVNSRRHQEKGAKDKNLHESRWGARCTFD